MRLLDVVFPEGLESIGENAFSSCYTMENINLPETVKTIGEGAFDGCEGVVVMSLPGSITTIPRNAFSYMVYLEELTIGEGTKTIDQMAFINCESLTKLTLPSTLESIGYAAFAYNMLTEVDCKAVTPPACDNTSFAGWDSDVPQDCLLYVPQGAKAEYEKADVWKEFMIKESETSGIESETAAGATETARYGIDGRKLAKPARGINIIRMSDGTAKKVINR